MAGLRVLVSLVWPIAFGLRAPLAGSRRLASRVSVKTVFIDGEGDEARANRKDSKIRREMINSADAVVLCLPDDAAIEAVSLVDSDVKIVDASTAHRVGVSGWEYGFAEMTKGQRERIQAATFVANPGCYATGFIGSARPLVDAGLLRPDARLSVSAISGYSGGGNALAAIHQAPGGAEPWGAYGFGLNHKHLPEMAFHSRLASEPAFLPAVGAFAQGMVVSTLLHYDDALMLPGSASGEALWEALAKHYEGDSCVTVVPYGEAGAKDLLERGSFLSPTRLNGSNKLEIFVFANDQKRTAAIVARLDNLGKGASGAAVQNLNLLLGLDESAGLDL
ncbi:hypothetical protein M885DRAFT_293018 [Pelagophyceae sp. CCMP2097]|nr:hypothetical protein M885DRAFT_293018 [Pelagophyceae sp. CCMP2097]